MNARQKAELYTQLATLARAGMPLHQATATLQRHFPQAAFRHLAAVLEQGHPLSTGMEAAGFSPFEARLVFAGERSGRLEIIFQQLADFWEREAELKSAVFRQSLYPFLLLHFAIFVGPVALLVTDFPLYVLRVVLNFVLLYGIGTALYIFGRRWWRQAPAQSLARRIPILGKAVRTAAAYRWIQVAEIEFSAGIPLPAAVQDAWLATGWAEGEAMGRDAHERLAAGDSLTELYATWPQLPRHWEMFIHTGESSGKLHESFLQLTVEARRDWEKAQKSLSEWLPRLFYMAIVVLVIFQLFSAYWAYFSQVQTLIDEMP